MAANTPGATYKVLRSKVLQFCNSMSPVEGGDPVQLDMVKEQSGEGGFQEECVCQPCGYGSLYGGPHENEQLNALKGGG